MEINSIYTRFASCQTSFETTLSLLESLLSERLNSDYRSIRVQGSNSGRINICFTLFYNTNRLNERSGFYESYRIRFQEVRNFRNFRPDGELGREVVQIENLIESFRTGCLSGIIS